MEFSLALPMEFIIALRSLLKSYLDKEIKIDYILQMLKIKRSRFFELLAKYRKDPDSFFIQYERKTIN